MRKKREITSKKESETLEFKTQPSLMPDVEIVNIGKFSAVRFYIPEFPVKPVSYRGKYFKRVGNSNHQMTLAEIANLHLLTFNSSWDSYPSSNYSIENISLEKVNQFVSRANKTRENPIADDPLTVLYKYELIKDAGVTNACHLLFSADDVFDAAIELGRFSAPTLIKDGRTSRCDLFSQVEDVLSFIKKHINKSFIITGNPQREERWQYPLEAIREIVINMIVHRNYADSGDSVVV